MPERRGLMQARIDYYKLSPGGYKAMLGLEQYLSHSGLEKNAAPHDQASGVADQRLRLLPRHALERFAGGGRKRATHVLTRRVARNALLQRPRTRRAGLGGSGHEHQGGARAG